MKLVDAGTGKYLWAERFDRALTADSLFAIQSEIAETVSRSLKSELTPRDRAQLSAMPTGDLDALDAYFDGRARMETRNPVQLREASGLFEKAIEADPDFALAYVALSDTYRLRSNYGSMSNVEADDRSEAAVQAALAINDELGEAHASLGNVLRRRGEFEAAEAAFLRGIGLNPNYGPLYQWYAEMLGMGLGRTNEAIRYAKIAVALDPRSAIIRRDYALRLAEAGQFDEANEQFDIAIDIDPGLALGYSGKAYMLHQFLGNVADALPLYERMVVIDQASPASVNQLGWALVDLGFFDQARDLLLQSMADAPDHAWSREVLALLLVLRGEETAAIEHLEFLLERLPGSPASVLMLRDHYLRRGGTRESARPLSSVRTATVR